MSDALAISGVTVVLQSMLHNVYSGASLGGSVSVTAVAPDVVQSALGTASDTFFQVNLFLHQVTPNAAWRNVDLPSLTADGGTRSKNPPLALDLHYLLTVYANGNCQAEALLGYAILMLHEFPVLSRSDIRTFLAGPGAQLSPSALGAGVSASGLADQVEMIKITPATMGREELAWLWTALKADYRPTYPFQVSVVLMQNPRPIVSALPVLSHGVIAQSGLPPTITAVTPPNRQPAAALGDTVTVAGENLAGTTGVILSNSRLGIQQTVTPLPSVGGSSFQFTLPPPAAAPTPPTPPTDLPAGVYLLSAQFPRTEQHVLQHQRPSARDCAQDCHAAAGVRASASSVTLSITCAPFSAPRPAGVAVDWKPGGGRDRRSPRRRMRRRSRSQTCSQPAVQACR